MLPFISTRSLHWFKKGLLFCCLSVLTTCAFFKIEQLLNQSLYAYHVDSSRMEPCGAWHFPEKIPKHASSVRYYYSFSEQENYMEISFRTPRFQSYSNISENLTDGAYTCVKSISVNPEKLRVTFIHRRLKINQAVKVQNEPESALTQGVHLPYEIE